ncbi:MAG TPA: lipoyl domain-containing protein [Candidatus Dormibacteraeota bacterium]
MRVELRLPRYGTSMEEGSIARWLKSPGDAVHVGDELCEVETDKVAAVYESPYAGRLVEILVSEGDSVPVGEVICTLDTEE